jgi:predicted nuclease of predicted toxin-antitoxin system
VSLRLFCDQCVSREVTELLRDAGHAVFVLRDHLPLRSLDPEVIAKAQKLKCLLVSLNGDFSDIITYPPSDYGGILAIQLHNHPEVIPALLVRLNKFLAQHPKQEYYVGKLFIVEVHRIRIRQ